MWEIIEARLGDANPAVRVLSEDAARRRLVEYFGKDKPLGEITEGDADDWIIWLKGKYAGATVGRTVRRAQQFFRAALRKRAIPENPFASTLARISIMARTASRGSGSPTPAECERITLRCS